MKEIEFFKYLKEDAQSEEFRLLMTEQKMAHFFRRFLPFIFRDYVLSVQGSMGHYCFPRDTFENPSIYSTMEVAIMDRHTSDFVDIAKDETFKNWIHVKTLLEGEQGIGVYGFIPVEIIEQLFQYLKQLERGSE